MNGDQIQEEAKAYYFFDFTLYPSVTGIRHFLHLSVMINIVHLSPVIPEKSKKGEEK